MTPDGIKLNPDHLEQVWQSLGEYSNFFGYYCHDPFNPDGKRVLAHRVPFEGRDLQFGDRAEVGAYSLDSGKWQSFGETTAFNWQDGAMLQWVPGSGGRLCLFNVLVDGKPRSQVYDTLTGKTRLLDSAVYTLHPSGRFGISTNFSRLAVCRPSYGYPVSPEEVAYWSKPIHGEDGINRVDLENGSSLRLFSTAEVASIGLDRELVESADHYLQHAWWNPSGSRFAFYHRMKLSDGGFKSRLFSADCKGKDLYLFPEASVYSHVGWKDDTALVVWARFGGGLLNAYARQSKAGARWLRPVRHVARWGKKLLGNPKRFQTITGAGYHLLHDRTPDRIRLAWGKITIDGHPTCFADGRFMLTDTYQDDDSIRHLLLYNFDEDMVLPLASFMSPFNSCGYRCDLHPRIQSSSRLICLDSAHTGNRQMYVFRLKEGTVSSSL